MGRCLKILFTLASLALPFCALALEYPFGSLKDNPSPCEYIKVAYAWGLGLVGTLAVTVIAYGGFLYMVGKVEQGRDYITSAFLGVLLLFGSYLILYTINPELAKLKCELKKIAPAVNLEALPTTQQAQEMTKQATEAVAPIFNPETQTLECPKGYNEQITEEGIKCNSPSSNIGQ